LFKLKSLFKAHTDVKIQSMHLNNGDEQNIQLVSSSSSLYFHLVTKIDQ